MSRGDRTLTVSKRLPFRQRASASGPTRYKRTCVYPLVSNDQNRSVRARQADVA